MNSTRNLFQTIICKCCLNRLLPGIMLLLTIVACKHDLGIAPSSTTQTDSLSTSALGKLTIDVKAKPVPKTYTHLVNNSTEFVSLLKTVKPGDTILMANDSLFDFSNYSTISIPGNLVIYSWRNHDKPRIKNRYQGRYSGAYLFTNNNNQHPLFSIEGPNVRFSGIRLLGADTLQNISLMMALKAQGQYWSYPHSRAIECPFDNLEVDNSEIAGFSHSAVYLNGGKNAIIHDNYIHHNQRWGTGYGVCLAGGTALITKNVFDYGRHATTGTGVPGEAYEASYNTLGPHFIGEVLDMHSNAAINPGTDYAGDFVNLHHNTSYFKTYHTIIIAGIPIYGLKIRHNVFVQPNLLSAIKLNSGIVNGLLSGNSYGYDGQYTPPSLRTY